MLKKEKPAPQSHLLYRQPASNMWLLRAASLAGRRHVEGGGVRGQQPLVLGALTCYAGRVVTCNGI